MSALDEIWQRPSASKAERVAELLSRSPLFQPEAGIDEQTLAIRAAEALERGKRHDAHFLSEREQTTITDALAKLLGLPTMEEIPE